MDVKDLQNMHNDKNPSGISREPDYLRHRLKHRSARDHLGLFRNQIDLWPILLV